MIIAICVPFLGEGKKQPARPHVEQCENCVRRADRRKTEKVPWQFVPVFTGACPSKIKEVTK